MDSFQSHEDLKYKTEKKDLDKSNSVYEEQKNVKRATSYLENMSRKLTVKHKRDSVDAILSKKKDQNRTPSKDSQQQLYRPEFAYQTKSMQSNEVDQNLNEKMWELMSSYIGHDRWSIQKQIVNHIEYSAAKSRFNFAESHCSQAVQQDPKRVYYLSSEFLIGRLMQNILVNINLVEQYKDSLMDLGYQLEDLYDYEQELGLGSSGLGRLAACFLDSMATLELPAWGYGIRYHYGTFKQHIIEEIGKQIEIPNFGLIVKNPWEIQRNDVQYNIQFKGEVIHENIEINGIQLKKYKWINTEIIKAMAYDTPVPGYNTFNTNCLRLWSAVPTIDLNKQSKPNCKSEDDYLQLIESRQRVERITSLLYYREHANNPRIQENLICQQYFFSAATIRDIIRRYKKRYKTNFQPFAEKIAIQLNDTHPGVAIIELIRIFIDIEGLTLHQAWLIVCNTFSYTSHSTTIDKKESWPLDIIAKLLPRHLQIIHYINFFLQEKIKKEYPNDQNKLARMNLIGLNQNEQLCIRMPYLCFIASHKVNGVSMEHTSILKGIVFKEFNELFQNRIISITNGVSQRRWIECANPKLSKLITDRLGGDEEWLINLYLLQQLNAWKFDKQFVKEWKQIRFNNKKRLIEYISINKPQEQGQLYDFTKKFIYKEERLMIDCMAKKLTFSKRHIMYLFYIILRYLKIKEGKKQLAGKVLYVFSGRAFTQEGKKILEFIYQVAKIINKDSVATKFMKIVFIPNYNVSIAQLLVTAADLSQHISTPGTEPSGTSIMKYLMNGGLIVGSRDGANLEIEQEIGSQNIYLFGSDKFKLVAYQKFLKMNKEKRLTHIDIQLQKVFDFIKEKSEFNYIKDTFVIPMENGNDPYGICLDFLFYCQAMDEASTLYFKTTKNLQKDEQSWVSKSITSVANSGKFSSDRSIAEYCDEIWNVNEISIPKGAATPSLRIKSFPDVTNVDKLREKMNTTQAPQSFFKT